MGRDSSRDRLRRSKHGEIELRCVAWLLHTMGTAGTNGFLLLPPGILGPFFPLFSYGFLFPPLLPSSMGSSDVAILAKQLGVPPAKFLHEYNRALEVYRKRKGSGKPKPHLHATLGSSPASHTSSGSGAPSDHAKRLVSPPLEPHRFHPRPNRPVPQPEGIRRSANDAHIDPSKLRVRVPDRAPAEPQYVGPVSANPSTQHPKDFVSPEESKSQTPGGENVRYSRRMDKMKQKSWKHRALSGRRGSMEDQPSSSHSSRSRSSSHQE